MYNIEAMLAAVPPKRLSHTMGVRETALMLAKRHFPMLDKNEVEAAAILHDITKYLSREEHLRLCEDWGVTLSDDEKRSPRVLHQLTGAETAKRSFGVSETVYSAIRCHTTGKENMKPLEVILLFADYIEPNRHYEGCEELRYFYEELYSEGNRFALEKAVIKALGMTIIEVVGRGEFMHPDIINARNSLILKINAEKEKKNG